jgi:ABC-2 type transport system permease protein
MLRFPAASWPWLLVHELRVGWRNIGGKSFIVLAVLITVLWAFMHVAGWALMGKLSLARMQATNALPIAGLVFWFVLSMVLSAAIAMAVNALFDRGDLDLLISSPIDPFAVFAVRGMGVAIGSIALVLMVVLPFVHMGIYHGQIGLIAAYPVLMSVALGSTGIAFAMTLILVRLLGARKARVAAQVLSALAGAALFLVSQMENLLPQSMRDQVRAGFKAFATSDWFGGESWLWWPVRAFFGEPLPALFVIALGFGLFWFVTRTTCSTFLAGTQQAVTRPAARSRPEPAAAFRGGVVRNVLRKEWLLIWRDPNLIAQSLLQVIYLVPVAFILVRKSELALLLAPSVILICASLAGNLAWMTIAGEEAADLIGSAPVDGNRVRWLKVGAVMAPILAMAIPFIAFYATRSPLQALVFAICLAAALGTSAVTQVWGGKPAGIRDLKLRYKQTGLLNFLEGFSSIGWAVCCYGLLSANWWALAGAVPGMLAPAIVLARRRLNRG